jgi:hypothetical protein
VWKWKDAAFCLNLGSFKLIVRLVVHLKVLARCIEVQDDRRPTVAQHRFIALFRSR